MPLSLPEAHASTLRTVYRDRRVTVTGGAGFIGGHLADALLDLGAAVTILDDLSNSTAAHVGALAEAHPDATRFLQGSVLDDTAVAEACEDAETVFHLAAVCSVPQSIADPERSWAVNATGTLRVLQAAHAAGARRVVLAASSSAYGDTPGMPKRESDLPSPLSPYAASKLSAEHLLRCHSESFGLSTVSLRYFNVFGPRQPGDSPYSGVIAAFAHRLGEGLPPVIYGDGSQTRDFTFVDNVVLANLLAGAAEGPLTGEVINIGVGERTSVVDLAEQMAAGFGHADLSPEFRPSRTGDVAHSLADVTRARELLAYEPVVGFAEGLARTVDWYRAHHAAGGREATGARA